MEAAGAAGEIFGSGLGGFGGALEVSGGFLTEEGFGETPFMESSQRAAFLSPALAALWSQNSAFLKSRGTPSPEAYIIPRAVSALGYPRRAALENQIKALPGFLETPQAFK